MKTMLFTVRLFLGEDLLEPADYDTVVISSVAIDRIVNSIYTLAHSRDGESTA